MQIPGLQQGRYTLGSGLKAKMLELAAGDLDLELET